MSNDLPQGEGGGSVGISLAVAEGLAKEGVHLALCARNEERVKARAKEISDRYGIKAIGISADVSEVEDIQRFVQSIKKEFGGTDILINNAGMGSNETIMDAPDEKWQFF